MNTDQQMVKKVPVVLDLLVCVGEKENVVNSLECILSLSFKDLSFKSLF